jgi:hypothetical protein
VIRQAITCDICASEKRQTNHWFVAYEQEGELRVSGWSSRHRLRQGSKHLCGQTCLHKLVDEFMASSIAVRSRRPAEEAELGPAHEPTREEAREVPREVADASVASNAAYNDAADLELDSSARLITHVPAPVESSRCTSRNGSAKAWERRTRT